MGSSRLPGKIMKKLMDRTVLAHVIERVKAVPEIGGIIIATTTLPQDEIIAAEADRLGVGCYRGSEQDVLSRYYEAAYEAKADAIVRITSDCPVLDPEVVSNIVRIFIENQADYASNTLERSFPRGLDAEVFTMQSLTEAYQSAAKPEQREHVTPFLYQTPERYRLCSYSFDIDYSHYRWTLDTQEDWDLIEKIYERLYAPNRLFTWQEVSQLMQQNPELPQINAHVEQKKLTQ
jgi:spore coat polysaccharide biosynthesis protein SpsF